MLEGLRTAGLQAAISVHDGTVATDCTCQPGPFAIKSNTKRSKQQCATAYITCILSGLFCLRAVWIDNFEVFVAQKAANT